MIIRLYFHIFSDPQIPIPILSIDCLLSTLVHAGLLAVHRLTNTINMNTVSGSVFRTFELPLD